MDEHLGVEAPADSGTGQSGQAQVPPPQPERPAVSKGKLLVGAVMALALMVGLYFVDRLWIAPAVKIQAKASKDHPLAPDFSLTDISGKKFNLSDYKGKVVILDFWATWCGPCLVEIPGFISLQKRYANEGLAVVGISMDSGQEQVVDFYRQYNMNYRVAVGDARLEELYGGIIGLPTTFVIGRDGRVYAKHEGAMDVSVFEEEVKQLLAAPADAEAAAFQQEGPMTRADQIELGDPKEIDSEVPGVDLSKLTATQKEAFKKVLEGQPCTCGCKMNLLKCRQVDRQCGISRKLAREQFDKFLKPSV